MSIDTWTAVGSIGTLIGLLIAIAGIVVPPELDRRRAADERAARLREALGTVEPQIGRINAILLDGHLLILAANDAAAALVNKLGNAATPQDLRKFLLSDPLSSAYATAKGLENNGASRLYAELESLRDSTAQLFGLLDVFSSCSALLSAIVNDSYVTVFENILKPPVLDLVIREHANESADEFRTRLPSTLAGNAAAYFVPRYSEVLGALSEFAGEAARDLSDLGAAKLLKASRAKAPVQLHMTHTETMRAGIASLQSTLDSASIATLNAHIDRIEALLSTEHATEVLQRTI